ncbi:hypothetical protein WR25_08911 [Diploscapter pachys]|uniref:CBF1-interacting co-repressor CIR N-terminal domain-containing protein n=1 Tax=Diploscapter pachys TaxID=2018661 RepID=A0A2A2KN57_9BILA|nr:hypothetical protein WR25_08911 [Diploscapter pachys]
MNILPKKRWHVRTKENVARVRKDEKKAAEEEERRLERQITAENERRMNALRRGAEDRERNLLGDLMEGRLEGASAVDSRTGHVNLFQDLEQEELKNVGKVNVEHEAEKKKEQQEWESKMGIQKMLAEGSNELTKKKEWYEVLPLRRSGKTKDSTAEDKRTDEEDKKPSRKRANSSSSSSSSDDRKKHKKKHKKEKKKRKKEKRRRDSSSEDEDKLQQEKKRKLEQMRRERLEREKAEAHRTRLLLNPELARAEQPKQPKYNSMFNPHLAK